jgi:elongation factor P--beta-lysine ligase
MNIQKIKCRSLILKEIREFFDNRGFLEVETPLLSPHLIPESSIENFKTCLVSPYGDDIPLYLTPSPEIWMKQLLAQGSGDIYQICKSFRNSEQISPVHNPEFTMLEWYKTGIDSRGNIKICEEMVNSILQKETAPECRPPFREITMEEAFQELAGFSLEENIEISDLSARLAENGIPRDYYRLESIEKAALARVPVRSSEKWLDGMTDFPACSGTAIGVDRLLSALMGDIGIRGVILFPLDDIIF